MLEDRYYMRRTPFDYRRSATVTFLAINVIVFILQTGVERFWGFRTSDYLALSLEGLKRGFVWQLFTYQFLHGGLLHLLFNCWAIYVFGRPVEEAIGRKPFVTLYLASGVVGGLVQVLAGLALPGYFGGSVVGASAATFGLVAAFAMLFPEGIIMLFFVLPLRAKYLLLLEGALAVLGLVAPPNPGLSPVRIAHAAHLGGMAAGVLFIRYAIHWHWEWPRFRPLQGRASRRLVRAGSGGGRWGRGNSGSIEDLPPEEFLSREVDPILDKISAHGIQSLTERERRILEAAREKMAKR